MSEVTLHHVISRGIVCVLSSETANIYNPPLLAGNPLDLLSARPDFNIVQDCSSI